MLGNYRGTLLYSSSARGWFDAACRVCWLWLSTVEGYDQVRCFHGCKQLCCRCKSCALIRHCAELDWPSLPTFNGTCTLGNCTSVDHGSKTLREIGVRHVIIELGERDIGPNIHRRVCAAALLNRYCTRSPQREQVTLREMCDRANDIRYFAGNCLEEPCFNRFVSQAFKGSHLGCSAGRE